MKILNCAAHDLRGDIIMNITLNAFFKNFFQQFFFFKLRKPWPLAHWHINKLMWHTSYNDVWILKKTKWNNRCSTVIYNKNTQKILLQKYRKIFLCCKKVNIKKILTYFWHNIPTNVQDRMVLSIKKMYCWYFSIKGSQ